jgi:hypothetical protein
MTTFRCDFGEGGDSVSDESKSGGLWTVVWVALALLPVFFYLLSFLLGELIEDWGIFLAAVLASQVAYAIGVLVAALRVTRRRQPK